MARGHLSHLDFSVGDPALSIPFYDALLTALGYRRFRLDEDAWQEPAPSRAAWGIRFADGSHFGIDLRPARGELRHRRYDRQEPGPHHLAFQVDDDASVDAVHQVMRTAGAEVLDPPRNYGGQAGYGRHYYAVFFDDPDGFKIEVVHAPAFVA
jgi:glyoxylase I family protein